MANYNKVLLIGNLTRDPELRYTPGGTPVCDFGLAVNRQWTSREGERNDETCFVDCTAWSKQATVISEYMSKGRPLFVEGRLKLDSWETPDGRRSKLKVVVENFQFLGKRGDDGGAGGAGGESRRDEQSDDRRGAPRGERPSSRQGGDETAPPEPEPAKGPEGFDVSDDEIPF